MAQHKCPKPQEHTDVVDLEGIALRQGGCFFGIDEKSFGAFARVEDFAFENIVAPPLAMTPVGLSQHLVDPRYQGITG